MLDLKLIKTSFNIFVFSLILGFAFNAVNPEGFNLVYKKGEMKNNSNGNKIVYISSEEAFVKHRLQSAIFIDARSHENFKISHIKDAVNINPDNDKVLYSDNKFNYDELNSQKEFVIYCGGVTCGLSYDLASELISHGYQHHIYIIKNGFPEWEESEYPVESSQ